MSLFDRMKEKLESAGKGAQKLTRKGQLKLDLMSAESRLETSYKELGKACATRFLEDAASTIEASGALGHCLDNVRRNRLRVAEIQTEIQELGAE